MCGYVIPQKTCEWEGAGTALQSVAGSEKQLTKHKKEERGEKISQEGRVK